MQACVQNASMLHLNQEWSSSHDIDNTFYLYPDVGIQMPQLDTLKAN